MAACLVHGAIVHIPNAHIPNVHILKPAATLMITNPAARFVFPFVVWLLPVIAFIVPPSVTVLGAVGAVGLLLSPAVVRRLGKELCTPSALVLAGLLVWAAVASAWSPNPPRSLFLAFRITLIFGGGLLYMAALGELDAQARRRVVTALAWGMPLLLLALGSEMLDGAVFSRFIRGLTMDVPFKFDHLNRNTTILAIFAWPAALALWQKAGRTAAVGFLALVAVYLWASPMLASLVAFVAGAIVFAATLARPRAVILGLAAIAVFGILLGPPLLIMEFGDTNLLTILAERFPNGMASIEHRVLITQFVLDRIAEHPVLGWGFDASRAIPGGQVLNEIGGAQLPLHPHNGALQVWLELGLIGAVLAAGVAGLLLKGLLGFADRARAAATGAATFTTFTLIAAMSYGVWQNWWLSVAWMATFVVLVPMTHEWDPR